VRCLSGSNEPVGVSEVTLDVVDMASAQAVTDGILESEDSRAEQQAENAIRVIEHWKSFAKRYGSRHGLLLYFRRNLCLDNLRLDTLCLQQKKQRTHRPAPGNPRGTGESKIHDDMLCRFRISEE
jgi:hypothetical protein